MSRGTWQNIWCQYSVRWENYGCFHSTFGTVYKKYFKVIFRPFKGIIPIVLLANSIFMCKLEFKLILWIRLYRLSFFSLNNNRDLLLWWCLHHLALLQHLDLSICFKLLSRVIIQNRFKTGSVITPRCHSAALSPSFLFWANYLMSLDLM